MTLVSPRGGGGPLALGEGRSHRGLARRGGATERGSQGPATRRGPTGENEDAGVPEQAGVTGTAAPLSSSSWASRPTEAPKRKEGPESRLCALIQKLSPPTKPRRWTCTLWPGTRTGPSPSLRGPSAPSAGF